MAGPEDEPHAFRRIAREDFEFAMSVENAFLFLSPAPADARALLQERGITAPTLQPESPVSA